MKHRLIAFAALILVALVPCVAQIVTTSPTILQRSSSDIVLTYHADSPLGNGGVKNLAESTPLYAHIGLITSKSSGDGDWKYTVTDWPNGSNAAAVNTAKNKFTYTTPNTYTLNIGSLASYFGTLQAGEYVKKIALVVRTADGSRQGKTATGGDIFIDVAGDEFQCRMSSTLASYTITAPTTATFTLDATAAAKLSISVNGAEIAAKDDATTLSAEYSFEQPGEYTVKGNAGAVSKEIKVSYPVPAEQKEYPGGVPRMGAVKNADGTVTFCLAAPGKNSAILVGSWDDYQVLDSNSMYVHDYKGNRYFWLTVSGLDNDKWYPYYYQVDKSKSVADPYAHLVLDCYNDRTLRGSVWRDRPAYPSDKVKDIMLAVYRGDIDDFEWTPFEIPAHDNLVIYEMLLRDFTGLDGKSLGWGTAKDATAKIQYIKDMGFNAVQLMPIMEFNGNQSWGYNTNFYMAPDKAYGSPQEYKTFIDECHKAGLAVILDIVFNQSDGLHPWYQLYPIDSNPFYNKTAPHNWSVLNDWKQDNPLVQQQWDDALRYWMTAYNVDGFRFDLVKGLGDNDSYGAGTEAYNASRVARMKRLHAVIKSVKPKGIHINENLAGAQEEKEMGEDGQLCWANVNDASSQFAQGYDTSNNNLLRFYSAHDGGRPWASTVSYAESHDEQRVGYNAAKYGNGAVATDSLTRYRRLGSLGAQFLMVPGPKMVWQFGELGNDQNTKSSDGSNDTGNKLVDWRLLDNEYCKGVHSTYSEVINFRTANPELFASTATYEQKMLGAKYDRPRTIRLYSGDKEVVLFVNPKVSGEAVDVKVASSILSASDCQLISASPGFTPTLTGAVGEATVSVPANCYALYASTSAAGIDGSITAPSDACTIIGGTGEIIILGDYNSLTVCDIYGHTYPTLQVPSGLYIVHTDTTTAKVFVR